MSRIVCDCGRQYHPDPKKDSRIKCKNCLKKVKPIEVKKRAIAYLGGKCVHCQFDNMAALDFHHRDPKKKSYKISGHYRFRWKELRKELDKCSLVCANCHRIIHNPNES